MTEILQIFQGNPLTTFIGKKIEAATRPELETDDWTLNLDICDMINESDDDAKDAVRAIKKRLQQIEQDRNFTVTNRTLTVLETCVSNCSRRFHVLVMTKDFIQDLVKLIGPKNNPPIELQERVLRLIERWAEAFRAQPDLGGVVAVYNDLKAKGVTFPPKDPNSNVPIQTPQRTVPPQSASPQTVRTSAMARGHQGGHLAPQPSGPVVLEGEGYNKISQDLAVVQSSVEMFNDIIRLLETKNEDSDWNLAADLNATCRQMKDRIVDLIERVANEDLTIELLRLNDELNNIFIKYDRLLKNRSKPSTVPQQPGNVPASIDRTDPNVAGQSSISSSSTTTRAPVASRTTETVNELSLIDFNAGDESNGEQSRAGGEHKDTVLDPFDTAAITEASSKLSKSSVQKQSQQLAQDLNQMSLSGDRQTKKTSGLPDEISSVREQDFAEIENWLSSDSGRDLASISKDMPSIEPISIPNSEFENFIASRALAGSTAPTTSSASSGSGQAKGSERPEPSV